MYIKRVVLVLGAVLALVLSSQGIAEPAAGIVSGMAASVSTDDSANTTTAMPSDINASDGNDMNTDTGKSDVNIMINPAAIDDSQGSDQNANDPIANTDSDMN